MGIVISNIIKNPEYAKQATVAEAKHIAPTPSDKEKFRLQLLSDFDMAEEYQKESERLQQKAMKFQRMAFERQKKAVLANLDYG